MVAQLANLNDAERDLMYKAPVLVTILIAGADSQIDKSEKSKAISFAKIKTISTTGDLKEYYKEVSDTFEQNLNKLIGSLPAGNEDRGMAITEELKKLNAILPKLNHNFAVQFYDSLKGFAREVAEASGGVLGYLSVSMEEKKLMALEMIQKP